MEQLFGRPYEYLPVPVWPVLPRDPQLPLEPGLLVTCGRFIERK